MEEKGIAFKYRNYISEPLSEKEIRSILRKLKRSAKAVLRKSDKAYKALGLTGDENETILIRHISDHPGLLQRPIAIRGSKAVLARPPENLLALID